MQYTNSKGAGNQIMYVRKEPLLSMHDNLFCAFLGFPHPLGYQSLVETFFPSGGKLAAWPVINVMTLPLILHQSPIYNN